MNKNSCIGLAELGTLLTPHSSRLTLNISRVPRFQVIYTTILLLTSFSYNKKSPCPQGTEASAVPPLLTIMVHLNRRFINAFPGNGG
jgi:hypothetical protein